MTARSCGLNDRQEYPLKIGSSFQASSKSRSFHTLRYDFKPASIDTSKPSVVEIKKNNEATVTVPHVLDSGSTTFKGGKRPCTKECILIIDRDTGEITLEKLSSTIHLKKSRSEPAGKKGDIRNAPCTKASNVPVTLSKAIVSSPSTLVSTTPGGSKPVDTPPVASANSVASAPASFSPAGSTSVVTQPPAVSKPARHVLTSTSSQDSESDSSSSDSSDSDSEEDTKASVIKVSPGQRPNVYSPPQHTAVNDLTFPQPASLPDPFMSTLHSDLQLSDSNSDSD